MLISGDVDTSIVLTFVHKEKLDPRGCETSCARRLITPTHGSPGHDDALESLPDRECVVRIALEFKLDQRGAW